MLRLIEAMDYRCLKSVSQPLNPFEILVGANASGKSTFLDVVGFLSDLVTDGLQSAVERRTANFQDLIWGREGKCFQLAVNARVPEERRFANGIETIRYEVSIRLDLQSETPLIESEHVRVSARDSWLSAEVIERTGELVEFTGAAGDRFSRSHQSLIHSSLNTIPVDSSFPSAAWLREFLRTSIRMVRLDAAALAKPSGTARTNVKTLTGAELARSVAQLKHENPPRYREWLAHVRSALPDVRAVDSVLREEDKHRYLVIQYENGLRVPAWAASEGTLRLLALTILAYLPDMQGVFLVEEPENGVHPTALETIYQSLSSMYEAQVFVASHSPVLLSMAKPDQILCFAKAPSGTKIVRGTDHPALRDWQGEVSLGTMVASGILG